MGDKDGALWLGVLLVALATTAVVFVLVKRQWSEQSFWLATMAFSLTTLAAVTLGRSGFGPKQALSSRYATYSIPLVVAVYVIFASQSRERRSRVATDLMCATLGLAMLGVGVSFVWGLHAGQESWQKRDYQRFVVYAVDSQPDEAISISPVKDDVRKYAAVLKKLKYSVFDDTELRARWNCQIRRCP